MFDLAKNFRTVTMQGMLECAGSGRSAYKPNASGTPWLETGGMGCPSWGGVRLADLLKAAGVKPSAAHVAGQGGDPGMVPTAAPVIRSIPMKKAMDDSTLVAWAMNGQPLPWVHGYPLRLVVPGWVGSASTKWLHTLTVLDAPFKGTYMDSSYRVPRAPDRARHEDAAGRGVGRGLADQVDDHLARAERASQRATGHRARPRLGRRRLGRARRDLQRRRQDLAARAARAGAIAAPVRVAHLHLRAQAERPGLRHLPRARLGFDRGNAQPAVPTWNPLGYFWNGWHRVGVLVEA